MTDRQKCLDAVLALGECTVGRVAYRVGPFISAAQCATWGRDYRKRSLKRGRKAFKVSLVATGLREIVTNALQELAAMGKLRRVARGVYAPPLPKIFKAS